MAWPPLLVFLWLFGTKPTTGFDFSPNLCHSWRFDVIDGEFREYMGDVLIDVANGGQTPAKVAVYLHCRWGKGGKNVQKSSKSISVLAGAKTTVKFHVRLPWKDRSRNDRPRAQSHRCFYFMTAYPHLKRSPLCPFALKSEFGAFLQSCNDKMRKLFVTVQREDELIKMHFVNHKHETIVDTNFSCVSNKEHNFHDIVWLLPDDDIHYNIDLEVKVCNVTSPKYLLDHECEVIVKRHCLERAEVVEHKRFKIHNNLRMKCLHPIIDRIAVALTSWMSMRSLPVAIALLIIVILLFANILTFVIKYCAMKRQKPV